MIYCTKGGNMKKPVIAICYDFDKTLAINDMQSFSFIPNLGLTTQEFWAKCNNFAKRHGMDITLCYLLTMIHQCKKKNIPLSREYLCGLGKDIKFFDGVETWFRRLNRYAETKGVKLEHYLISSGNKEILEGCKIIDEFDGVFGCEFLYDKTGAAIWPKTLINHTLKTQCLFRICKGAHDLSDDKTVNRRTAKKHVEFRNMIYIGDGVTDVPCMTLVKERGGTSIAVYQDGQKDISLELVAENRVNYACKTNFKTGSGLEKLVKLIIDSLTLQEKLFSKERKTKTQTKK